MEMMEKDHEEQTFECGTCNQDVRIDIPNVKYYLDLAKEYATFCVKCDRLNMPLICLEDYIKQLTPSSTGDEK